MVKPIDESRPHKIIDRPHEYRVIRLDLQIDHNHRENTFLDLTLLRKDVVRRLRFLRPTNLIIDEGFPEPTNGMQILDIRHKQWDDVKVQVTDFEGASHGAITFLAADVIDLDTDA